MPDASAQDVLPMVGKFNSGGLRPAGSEAEGGTKFNVAPRPDRLWGLSKADARFQRMQTPADVCIHMVAGKVTRVRKALPVPENQNGGGEGS